MAERFDPRTHGAELLLEADRTRRMALGLRAVGAVAAAGGAIAQSWLSPGLGGLLLAGGLLLLAVADEVRRRALELSRVARRAAREALAEELGSAPLPGYLRRLEQRPRAA